MTPKNLKITTAKQAFISSGVLCALYLAACGVANQDITLALCCMVMALTGLYVLTTPDAQQPAASDTPQARP